MLLAQPSGALIVSPTRPKNQCAPICAEADNAFIPFSVEVSPDHGRACWRHSIGAAARRRCQVTPRCSSALLAKNGKWRGHPHLCTDLFSSPFLPFCLAPLSKHFPLSLFPLNFPFLFYSNHNCNMHDHLISVTTFTFVLVLIWKGSFLTRCELYSRGKLTCSQKFVFSSLPLLVWLS